MKEECEMTRQETVLGNARIVLADRVIERGWVAFVDGRVADAKAALDPDVLVADVVPFLRRLADEVAT